MAVLERLTEEEAALVAILTDPSGSELAEFAYRDDQSYGGRYRLWDMQWPYYHCAEKYQVDASGRGVGKSVSAVLRACAFVFNFPGQEMLVTAPELSHLSLVTDKVEENLLKYRILKEMLKDGGRNAKANGIRKSPHWQVTFSNSAKILSRLPGRTGKGVKGPHPLAIELDELQDFPRRGFTELTETIKISEEGAIWRCIAAGQLVLTRDGWIPIEKVQVGQEVWTHQARWKPVLNVFDNGFQDCVSVSGQGHFGLEMTPNHKVWGAASRRQKVGGRSVRVLGAPSFRPLEDLAAAGARWASPTSLRVDLSVPPMVRKPRSRHAQTVDTTDPRWLWLYGLYLAEGYACDFPVAGGGTSRRVHWCVNDVEAAHVEGVLASLGLASHRYAQGRSVKVVLNGQQAHDWLTENAGRLATEKSLAGWVFGLDEDGRRAVLDGALYGDGSWSERRQRWEYGTSSRALAFDVKMLAQTLGAVANVRLQPAHQSVIEGRTVWTKDHYVVQITEPRPKTQTMLEGGMAWGTVRPQDVQEVGQRHVYDLEVQDDHSYVVEGVVVSNCHGVSNGVGDIHYELTSQEKKIANDDDVVARLPFFVHRYIAAHRPTWNDAERAAKIAMYGGEDSPDYIRNIFGEPGSASNPVFVLSRLMACVRMDDVFNKTLYQHVTIDEPARMAAERNDILIEELWNPLPALTDSMYTSYWGGMDVGFTTDPSEVLIFGTTIGKNGKEVSRLVLRMTLKQLKASDQLKVLAKVFATLGHRLQRFAMDRTGNGRTISELAADLPDMAERIVGYGFSEKGPVAFDDRPLERGEKPEDLVIEKIYVRFATEVIRKWVDENLLELPYDVELLGQLQMMNLAPKGENVVEKSSGGADHAFDAIRMFVLAKALEPITRMLEKPKKREPVLDIFF